MKILMWVASALVTIAAIVLVVGWLRPAGHVATTEAEYAAPAEALWGVIADLPRWAEWNPDIKSMERLPDRDGREVWMARGGWGDLPTEIVRSEPARLLETFVDGGAFSGTWVYELSPTGSGTLLRVTERGEVSNPFFRAMMIFHDNYESMRTFHAALAERLGETVVVRELGES
jgi:hypothetical protein